MKKRILAIMLAMALAFSATACAGAPATSSEGTSSEEGKVDSSESGEDNAEVPEGFVVGSTTDLNGDFMSGWSNGAQNKSVKNLIGGYATYEFVEDQSYQLNDIAVANVDIKADEATGNKTYTFTLNDNLVWNNGDPITATDYVFSSLLFASPEFGQLDGGDNTGGSEIVGYDEFNAGETKTFSGIKLIDELTFSVTIKGSELPYYFEETLVAIGPTPIKVIAPGTTITDDGNGATLSAEFTVDTLTKTVLDPETGYRYNPQVTCGPYNLVSFDDGSLIAVLEINDKFLGTAVDHAKPTIERLVLKSVTTATEMDELKAGTVDLLPGISGGESINTGLDIVDEGLAGYTSYDRSGYGKLAFACEFGPTQFAEVRQAIAYCLDRVEFANQYTGGYGTLPHGYYGMSQWEYQENRDKLEEVLNPYTFDLAKAEEVLVASGWTLNEKGEEFVKGTDAVRYKKVGEELMPLIVKWASSQDNPVSDLLAASLPQNAEQVGMKIEQTVVDFGTLLDALYRETEDLANYHMFNLATGFATISPLWYYVSTDPAYFGTYNTDRISDAELERIALEMKAVKPGDQDSWSALWLEFQKRYNELVVNLPLYSDEYHEFFTPELKNYTPDALWSWEYAILRAEME